MRDVELGSRLRDFVCDALRDLDSSIAPGLRLPRVFGGHLVRSDALADLLYLLALLIDAGVDRIAAVDLRLRVQELLLELEPSEVEGFYSYRVAESVSLLGGLAELSPVGRQRAIAAATSTRLLQQVVLDDSGRSPNFTVVAARCLHALEQLGVPPEHALERRVWDQAEKLFAGAPRGWINDGRSGYSQFDIYTPEMYLLAEPFRERLAPHWHRGISSVLVDLEKVCHPRGVVTWGRSVGAHAGAMSLEVSVLALAHGLGDQQWWASIGHDAAEDLEQWFRTGLATTDQGRSSDSYRGSARRLQQTFDLLGKMAWSASRLRRETEVYRLPGEAWPDVDELVRFSAGAAAWTHRSRSLSFVIPLMMGRFASYLPSPYSPGLFEQPSDGPPLFVPTIIAPGGSASEQTCLVPAGVPVHVSHNRHELEIRHDGWARLGEANSTSLKGGRTAAYRVEGRTLHVSESISIQDAPEASVLALSVGEVAGRPLSVEFNPGLDPITVDTADLVEWRTHWGEVERVHQVEVALAECAGIRLDWKVTPHLVVATTEPDHQYTRLLYGTMSRIALVAAGAPSGDLRRRLRSVDVLHIAWPERWVGVDPGVSREVIGQLRAAGIRIVWTQHNLIPHRDRSEGARQTYALWAEAADGVIHHSHYGKQIALAAYHYPRAQHFVIPHGHWGREFPPVAPDRESVEAEEGWPSTALRLGIIGQPRREKALQAVVDAVEASGRDDIQLVARLANETRVPSNPRIIANYGHIGNDRYYRRLTAIDGVILPFEGDTLLTTGTAFDCIGGGIAAIASPWGFLQETFGECAIWYDGSRGDLVTCLSSLTADVLREAGTAARSLQQCHDWEDIGQQTLIALELVASGERETDDF